MNGKGKKKKIKERILKRSKRRKINKEERNITDSS